MAEVMHVKATGSDASRRVDGRSRDGGQTGVGRLIGRGLDACRTGVTVWKSALRCVSDGLAAVFCVFAEIFYGGRGLNAKTAKSAKVNAKSVVKIFKSRRRDRNPFKISKNKSDGRGACTHDDCRLFSAGRSIFAFQREPVFSQFCLKDSGFSRVIKLQFPASFCLQKDSLADILRQLQ
jgi:hypothetical protein